MPNERGGEILREVNTKEWQDRIDFRTMDVGCENRQEFVRAMADRNERKICAGIASLPNKSHPAELAETWLWGFSAESSRLRRAVASSYLTSGRSLRT